MKSPAFQVSTALAFSRHAHHLACTPSRSVRRAASARHIRPQACLPSNKNEENTDTQQRQTHAQKSVASQWSLSQTNKRIIAEAESTFDELDTMAEQWIGSSVPRWEWYEGLKARREKLMVESKKTDKEMDESYERLQKTFMEFDAVFGTKLLDSETRISPTGWGLIVLTMFLYVCLGYAAIELVVKLFTEIPTNMWY